MIIGTIVKFFTFILFSDFMILCRLFAFPYVKKKKEMEIVSGPRL